MNNDMNNISVSSASSAPTLNLTEAPSQTTQSPVIFSLNKGSALAQNPDFLYELNRHLKSSRGSVLNEYMLNKIEK